ncbi:MAG: GEVED domain-containing protein [Chitinophagales bacterium]|nr:T9SS type A sorting domain-containing protein [Chitinophagales bacterium]MDW8393180.1 GEVED domain-containing protein [Chitinophagales bacterium]
MGKRFHGIFLFLFAIGIRADGQYCIPVYTNSCSGTGSYINKFTFHTINNSNSGCNGNPDNYILYPASGNKTTSVTQGSTISFSVKPGSGSGNDQGFGIWVDWNNDQDFGDAHELIYCSPGVTDDLISGTFPVPLGDAYLGQRRLRVRSARSAIIYPFDYCTPFDNGETEDYTISVLPAPACSGMPVAGSVLAFPSSLCQSGQDVTLLLTGYSAASQLAFQWEQADDGINWQILSGATESQVTISQLATSTFFRASVTCLASGQQQYTNPVHISVGPVWMDSATGDTLCGSGTAHLTAAGNAEEILWYSDPVTSVPFASSVPGDTLPVYVTQSTTFYAAAASGSLYMDSVGMKDPTGLPGDDGYKNGFLVFDVFYPCTLAGIHVYPSDEGLLYIHLRDSAFTTLQQVVVSIAAQQVGKRTYVPLNFSLNPGNGFQLFLSDESKKLWTVQGSVTYPYVMPGVLQIRTSNLGPGYYHYFYDWIVVSGGICLSERTAVPVHVVAPPALTITSGNGQFAVCTNQADSLQLSATAGFQTYHWHPAAGLSAADQPSIKAFPSVSTVYTLTAILEGCTSQAQAFVQVHEPPSVQVTPSQDTLCAGTSIQLSAIATPLLNYLVKPVPFVIDNNAGIPVPLADDALSPPLPIGFSFGFFGKQYDTFYISSNGFITFDPTSGDGCCTGQLLPNPFPPNNLIALAWEDLSPNLGGTVSYYTTGTAPHRKLVVRFDSVSHFSLTGPVDPVTVRAELYEEDFRIEIHTTQMPGNPSGNWFGHTQGLEGEGGLQASVAPGRNSTAWTASQSAYRFIPQTYSYQWIPAEGLSDPTVANPLASPQQTTQYSLWVTNDVTGCSTVQKVDLFVLQEPFAGLITPSWVFICDTSSVVLEVTNQTAGAQLQWQQFDPVAGVFVDLPGSTSEQIAITAAASGIYRVRATCSASSFSDTAQITYLMTPPPPTGLSAERCGTGKLTLSASGQSDLLCWYTEPQGGVFLGMGTSLVLSNLLSSDTVWVEEGPPPPQFIATSLDGGVSDHGTMLQVYAHEHLMITGLDLHLAAIADLKLKIYYRKGSYEGYENQEDKWICAGSVTVTGKGLGQLTPLPLPLSISVSKGQTLALYVTATTPHLLNSLFSGGSPVIASDSLISIMEGIGMVYPFGAVTGSRQFNGRIYYQVLGCSSGRTPVPATVFYPQIQAVLNATTVCAFDTIMLEAVNLGKGNFTYQWYPLLEGTVPPDGAAAQIWTIPVQSTLFTLIATEVTNQCDTIVQLFVEAFPLPQVSFVGLPDTMHTLMQPVVLTGVPSGGTFSGPGIVNGNVFDPAVAGPGIHTITYTFTDNNSCSNQAVAQVVVLLYSSLADGVSSISIYPNPATTQVRLHCMGCEAGTRITVADLSGRVYANLQDADIGTPVILDVRLWPAGMYWVSVVQSTGHRMLPFVVAGRQ